jgi:hypothetical protein
MRNPAKDGISVSEALEANGDGEMNLDVDELDEALEGALEETAEEMNGTPGESLLTPQEVTKYKANWDVLQVNFIDDPLRAVENADSLVDTVLKRLTDSFQYERDHLVRRWDHGGEPVSTEDLRLALKGYRVFLERLLLL